jgi:predicted Zn-ribbon and HTH transcriptional regulator
MTQLTCTKCARTLDESHFTRDSTRRSGRRARCKACGYYKPVVRANRTSKPCRQCQRSLDHSHYKLPNSWYCNECVALRREQHRLAQPGTHCIDCGTYYERDQLLKTVDRCIHCESVQKRNRKLAQYADHVYSTNRRAVNKRRQRRDPFHRLSENIRTLIANSIARNGYTKHSRTSTILDCDYDQFAAHIESQFAAGMSWDNRELWHLDHRVPISLARTEEELLRLNRWDNFQPLWSGHNQSKSATLESSLDPVYVELLNMRTSKR